MKQTHKILFFLGCLLAFFAVGTSEFRGTATTHTKPLSEKRIIEEEREYCEVIHTIQEENVEVSGGNPDLQPVLSFLNSDEFQETLCITVRLKTFATYSYPYLGKVPLYLKYQSLKLHC